MFLLCSRKDKKADRGSAFKRDKDLLISFYVRVRMEKPIQTFLLGHSGGNGCYSCKEALILLLLFAVALGTSQASRLTLHLAVVLSHLSYWTCILPMCREDLRQKKCFRTLFLVLKEFSVHRRGFPAVPPSIMNIFSLWSQLCLVLFPVSSLFSSEILGDTAGHKFHLKLCNVTHVLFGKYVVGFFTKHKAELRYFPIWGMKSFNLNWNVDLLIYCLWQTSSDFPSHKVFMVISQFMKQNYVFLST